MAKRIQEYPVGIIILVSPYLLIRKLYVELINHTLPIFFVVFGLGLLVLLMNGDILGVFVLTTLMAGLFFLGRTSIFTEWRNRKVVLHKVAKTLGSFLLPNEPEPYFKARRKIKVVRSGDAAGVYRLDLRTPQGRTDEDVIRQMESVSSQLGVVRWLPYDNDERKGYVSAVMAFRDVLKDDLPSEKTPVLHMTEAQKTDPYCWLEVGRDVMGRAFDIPLAVQNGGTQRGLHQGESRSGKSSMSKQQALFALLNYHYRLAVTDGKGSEYSWAEDYADSYWKPDSSGSLKGFFEQLRYLESEVQSRSELLARNKKANPNRFASELNPYDDGAYFLLWVWDELARVKSMAKPTELMEIDARVNAIASVAGSLGIAIIFSAQAFRHDILSTLIRNNSFDVFIGYKSNSEIESGYIGFSASDAERPDTIKGTLDKAKGRMSSAGQFVARGLKSGTGKAYFLRDVDIVRALEEQADKPLMMEIEDYLEAQPADSN